MIYLTRAQVREVDRLSIDRYHIPGIVLMENAARAVTAVALQMLAGSTGEVLILCGGGNNGGDGLAAARHLHNARVPVSILLTTDPRKYTGDAKTNWDIIESMKLKVDNADIDLIQRSRPALILDAIFGTGLSAPPREPFPQIVSALQELHVPILAIDIPSGLDCDTGKPLGPACIRATRTVTFVAGKSGFANKSAEEYLGQVIVGDIGCPRELVDEVRRL